MSLIELNGLVLAKSHKLQFSSGCAGFVEIKVLESEDIVYITFSGDQAFITFQDIQIDFIYCFHGLLLSSWGDHCSRNQATWYSFSNDQGTLVTIVNNDNNNNNNTATTTTNVAHVVNRLSSLSNSFILRNIDFSHSKFIDLSQDCEKNLDLVMIIEESMKTSFFDRLTSPVTEMNIQMKVLSLDERGWLEIDTKFKSRLFLYFNHYRLPEYSSSWTVGSIIICHSVLPIILWNNLRGFVCTVRTTFTLSDEPKHIHELINPYQVTVPEILRSRSYIFTVWWHHTLSILLECIPSLSPSIQTWLMNKLYISINEDFKTSYNQSFDKLFQLPSRSIQNEFTNLIEIELKLIRSCQDIDYLGNILPNVISVASLQSIFRDYENKRSEADQYQVLDGVYRNKILNIYDFISSKIFYFVASVVKVSGCSLLPKSSVLILLLKDFQSNMISCMVTGSQEELRLLCNHFQGVSLENGMQDIIVIIRNPLLMEEKIVTQNHNNNISSSSNSQSLFQQDQQPPTSSHSNIFLYTTFPSIRIMKIPNKKRTRSCFHTHTITSTSTHIPSISQLFDFRSVSIGGEKIDMFHSTSSSIDSFGLYDMLSVRQLLHLSFHRDIFIKFCYGVVIHKMILLPADNNQNSISNNGSIRKYAITLRELSYPDTITIYITVYGISFQCIDHAIVGSIVILKDITIQKSASLRQIYGKFNIHSSTSLQGSFQRIGIIGFIHEIASLQKIFDLSSSSSSNKPRIGDILNQMESLSTLPPSFLSAIPYYSYTDLYLLPPPDSYFAILEEYRLYDRCSWTIIGRVDAIKVVTVVLRCSFCYSQPYRTFNSSVTSTTCQKCYRANSFIPMWEGKLIVDDGTSTAFIYCEGDMMTNLLYLICGKHNKFLSQLIESVEEKVKISGYEKYDTFMISRNIATKLNVYGDWIYADADPDAEKDDEDEDDEDEDSSSIASLIKHTDPISTEYQPSLESDPILELFRRALSHPHVCADRLQFIVQLIHKNIRRDTNIYDNTTSISSNQSSSSSSSTSTSFNKSNVNIFTRNITLQEWSDDKTKRYMIVPMIKDSLFVESIKLECRYVSKVYKERIEGEVHKYIQQLHFYDSK